MGAAGVVADERPDRRACGDERFGKVAADKAAGARHEGAAAGHLDPRSGHWR